MKSPSPSDFQLWLFFDPVSVIPWIFLLPLTFIVIVNNCESKLTTMRFKAGLALYGQMLEALSLPYVLTGAAIGWVIVVNSPDNPSWIGGLIIGWALPGGLALASGYLITRHTGYYRLAKPLSRWAAYFIIFGLWGWTRGYSTLVCRLRPSFFAIYTSKFHNGFCNQSILTAAGFACVS